MNREEELKEKAEDVTSDKYSLSITNFQNLLEWLEARAELKGIQTEKQRILDLLKSKLSRDAIKYHLEGKDCKHEWAEDDFGYNPPLLRCNKCGLTDLEFHSLQKIKKER